jgi:multicomponent Na+:H+ antiporter subunit A
MTIYGAGQLTASVQIGYLRIYLRITVLTTVILMASVFLLYPLPAITFDFSDLYFYEHLIFFITAITAIAATVVNSRLSAIACLGVIGFMVATIYSMYSAPDLAMTQILVETLTVIVFALVIYRLPNYVKLSHAKTRIWDATVAISFGVMMTVLVWYATEAHHQQEISYYHGLYSYSHGFGRNVVNVILVDFRALDTLGEILVVAVAFLGVYSLLRAKIKKGVPI